jgi:hypothetical protein
VGPSTRRAGGRPFRYPNPPPGPFPHSHGTPMSQFGEARYAERLPGAALTADQIEFALAMERYMRLNRRPFPTWHEVLAVIKALGYRKVAPPAPRPERPPSE